MIRLTAIVLLTVAIVASGQVKKKAVIQRPAVTYSVDDVNDAGNRPDLVSKAEGTAALRAQILLDRANFSAGQIDGTIGNNTEVALTGFRIQRQVAIRSWWSRIAALIEHGLQAVSEFRLRRSRAA